MNRLRVFIFILKALLRLHVFGLENKIRCSQEKNPWGDLPGPCDQWGPPRDHPGHPGDPPGIPQVCPAHRIPGIPRDPPWAPKEPWDRFKNK